MDNISYLVGGWPPIKIPAIKMVMFMGNGANDIAIPTLYGLIAEVLWTYQPTMGFSQLYHLYPVTSPYFSYWPVPHRPCYCSTKCNNCKTWCSVLRWFWDHELNSCKLLVLQQPTQLYSTINCSVMYLPLWTNYATLAVVTVFYTAQKCTVLQKQKPKLQTHWYE